MTRIPGVPDRDQIRPGMAFYIGTGPKGKTCGTCAYRGYYTTPTAYHGGCAMFRKLAGKHGAVLWISYPACKYYETQKDASRSPSGSV